MKLISRLFALALLLATSACSSPEKMYDVKGKVTFQGQPVSEGDVQLIDEKTGRGSQVALKSDGTYEAQLHAALYKVVITPPYIADDSNGMPNPKYKKVNNIPAKYHSTATSGLTADVSADRTIHDFDLKP
jgi:hypothetical protein